MFQQENLYWYSWARSILENAAGGRKRGASGVSSQDVETRPDSPKYTWILISLTTNFRNKLFAEKFTCGYNDLNSSSFLSMQRYWKSQRLPNLYKLWTKLCKMIRQQPVCGRYNTFNGGIKFNGWFARSLSSSFQFPFFHPGKCKLKQEQ